MTNDTTIAAIRKEYRQRAFLEENAYATPLEQFDAWWKEALEAGIEEPNAMTLATAGADGTPAARTVLLKSYGERGFVFFTNYESAKGRHLEENPKACLLFFWKELERQVRITGDVERVTAEESDDYFGVRPEGSRIGAWASPQSRVIPGRQWLEENVERYANEFLGKPPTRPLHWGGFRVSPVSIEFWQGRANRLHDRLRYSPDENGKWIIERLAP